MPKFEGVIVEPSEIRIGSNFNIKIKVDRSFTYEELEERTYEELEKVTYDNLLGG